MKFEIPEVLTADATSTFLKRHSLCEYTCKTGSTDVVSCPPFSTLFRKIGGPEPDPGSGFKGGFPSVIYRLGGEENITVEVNNVLVNKEVHNVFGVIKGLVDPGRFDPFSLLFISLLQ